MTPRERLVRSVNWALGLTLLSVAIVVFAIGLCQPAAMNVVQASVVIQAGQENRPPPDAPQKEWDEWNERQKPVRDAAHHVAGKTIVVTALFVGVPTAVLLIAVCVLLYRAKVWLRRGA